jgi:hypothetical protein
LPLSSGRRRDPGINDASSRDCSVTPHLVEELLFGDDPVPLSDQLGEDVEHLRLDRADGAVPAQLEASEVQLVVPEGIDHRRQLRRFTARAASGMG